MKNIENNMNLNNLIKYIQDLLPDAQFETDNYGQLVIYTGMTARENDVEINTNPELVPWDGFTQLDEVSLQVINDNIEDLYL